MTIERKREIVIEFERVQLIRKRAKTSLRHCDQCQAESDFVGIEAAAELFGADAGDLRRFAEANGVHSDTNSELCIPSLLTVMHARHESAPLRFLSPCENGMA